MTPGKEARSSQGKVYDQDAEPVLAAGTLVSKHIDSAAGPEVAARDSTDVDEISNQLYGFWAIAVQA